MACGGGTTTTGGGGATNDAPKSKFEPVVPPNACGAGATYLAAFPGDPISFDPSQSGDVDGTLVRYSWDFHYDQTGFVEEWWSASPDIATVTYPSQGSFTVALRVTDDGGATDTTTFSVRVHDASQALLLVPDTFAFGTPRVGDAVTGTVNLLNVGTQTYEVQGVIPDRPEVIAHPLTSGTLVAPCNALSISVDFLSFKTDAFAGDVTIQVKNVPDLLVGYSGQAQSGFATVGPMTVPRKFHTATRLQSGKVLIVGGEDDANQVLDSVEIYDPATRTFTPGPSLSSVAGPEPVIGPRSHHTATLMSDGTVLVAGGTYTDPVTLDARIHNTGVVYDPYSGGPGGQWIYNFRLAEPRTQHTATRIVTAGGGERVLLAGGRGDPGDIDGLDTVEVITGTGAYVDTGQLVEPRLLHAAVALDNHRVLIAGGQGPIGGAPDGAADGAEIFDLDTFASTFVPMPSPRYDLTLTRVASAGPGSRFLAVGGGQLQLGAMGVVTEYTAAGFEPALGRLLDPRRRHKAVDLGAGRGLLVVGGISPGNSALDRAEIVHPSGDSVRAVADRMSVPRGGGHQATLLLDGSVLVTGGIAPGLGTVDTAELYVPEP